jgi:hypothetical protein
VPRGQTLDVGFVFVDYQDQSLYQLRQWLQPLERLQSKFSVKVFYTSPDVAKELERSSIEGVYFEGQDELTEKLYELSPKVLLYANQNVRNFYPLRYPEAVHVFVSHGESDKAYMSQNTIKRYDLYFAAGEAAADRISSKVKYYDSAKRIIQIGRPQSLDIYSLPEDFVQSGKKKVLYAPTWEGVTKATRYTSIISHGAKLVQALVDSSEYQVTYRPHPLSGSRDAEVKSANEAIKKIISQAVKSDSSSAHYIDESPFGWHLGYHYLMISDISAIAYDWLSTGNPILLTKPVEKKAVVEDFPLVDKLYSITTEDLVGIEKLIAEQFNESSEHKKISAELNAYYFKQPTSQSDEHFVSAVSQAIELHGQKLVSQEFPKLGSFESRGGTLGLLRYPNFAIREALRLTGTWSTAKQLTKLEESDEFYIHLSDPFNRRSVIPSVEAVLRNHLVNQSEQVPEGESKAKRLVLILNQVTSLLAVKKLLKRPEFKSLASDVVMVPVANATDCEAVVAKLKPLRAWYLKHHPLNHMLLRLNGLEHGLFRPDIDPLFVPDHSLITYDLILEASESTSEYVNRLLESSRPELRAPPSF